ncbi:hypothetical protein WL61_02680 [Burkholderia ubonensis]|uniref:HNH endonuclease n=1 Tax=Burkholderia ubonensis TaxID=101571 RepID=UPI000754DF34|nr:HNH endonuclease [Burkholderia ubonensis]KVN94018.1 hypothetical protein WJ71_03080 [Burkholderia ubonensis]KVO83937.1 hypothetical protein WJ80_17905 [Burkholderia ubonensis]KVR23907.1 hypothetical protein WK14_16730 [Burkholderia ubonensis]KWD25509.1 hypothetical protein WL61_02680 [Burkholderia ubonensis]KWD27518.1 hypothetical protein WL62_07985 [Burkholderia ubonensis]
MNLLEWAETNEFKDLWKVTFKDSHDLLAAFGKPSQKPRAYSETRSHWLELREPCDGIRLIAVEFPFTVSPARLYLRAWMYRPEGNVAYDAMQAQPFEYAGKAGKAGPRYPNESPRGNWRSQLAERDTTLRGIRHVIYLDDLEKLPQTDVGPALCKVVKAFCDYLAQTVSQLLAPTPAGPAFIVPESASDPPEAPATLIADITAIARDPRFQDLPPPVRVALSNARIGQGGYRKRVLGLWDARCALTGCAIEEVLIASHARPFALCDTAAECLDEYNGLLLSANIDRLFDSGLIAFLNDGTVLLKAGAGLAELVQADRLRTVHPRHVPYLTWHRKHFGFE